MPYQSTMRIKFAVTFIAVLIVTSCVTSSKKVNPVLREHLLAVDTVAIVPVVTIEEIDSTRPNQRMTEREARIKSESLDFIKGSLSERGYRSVVFDVDEVNDKKDSLRPVIADLRRNVSQAKLELRNQSDEEKKQGKLVVLTGQAYRSISEEAQTDAVLLVRYIGFAQSTGDQASDIAVGAVVGALTGVMPFSQPEKSDVEITLINGVTGEMLWTEHKDIANVGIAAVKRAMSTLPNVAQVAVKDNSM